MELRSLLSSYFSGDKEAIGVAKKVGACLIWGLPKSNSWIDGSEWQLDSPMSVLKFGPMSLWGKLRMGMGLLFESNREWRMVRKISGGRHLTSTDW